MQMTKKILILPGDGIGQEVTAAAKEVLDYLTAENNLDFAITHMDVGGTAYENSGSPLPDKVLSEAKGGWRTLMWVAGASSAVTAFLIMIYQSFGGK